MLTRRCLCLIGVNPLKYDISHQIIKPSKRFSTATLKNEQSSQEGKSETGNKKLSKAMIAYIERSNRYNEFIKKEQAEYNVGKRHLANMMGCDPETFTQQQVDEAIEYLFPSGLFEQKARPMMKPPSFIFPPKKEAQFEENGRPFHYLFYTGKPNFYSILHEMVGHLKELNNHLDELVERKAIINKNDVVFEGYQWISKEGLENKTVEQISDREYEYFVLSMERLIAHKLAYKAKDFIQSLRTPLMDTKMNFSNPPKPSIDEKGRSYITTKECPRKSARADVTVYSPGTGVIDINGEGIEYFSLMQSRNQILFPLELSGLLGSVDIVATVRGGGISSQAGAIRWGIAWGLRSFVSQDMIETMRLAGLLTRDFRKKERKKPGQEGARRKFTWKKR